MQENLSTKFPKPPELQPIPTRAKIWQMTSLILIIGGLVLSGAGGWMFYLYQLEASKPPPAPILDMSTIDDVQTFTAQSSPTFINPTATSPGPSEVALALECKACFATPYLEPTRTPTSLAEPAFTPAVDPPKEQEQEKEAETDLVQETVPVAQAEPVAADEPEEAVASDTAAPPQDHGAAYVTETKFLEEFALAQEIALTPEPALNTAPSLADNPLVVAEDIPAETELVSEADVPAPAGSPPTRIVAESINLDTEVIEVGWQQVMRDGVFTNVWVVADYAAGWHKNSTTPGQGGNVVLSGHHNIKGEVFRYLVDLEVGDTVTLYVGDFGVKRYDYTVSDKFILKDRDEPESVRRANARWIGPFNEERLTLITCWPYTNNTHRLIVVAKPVNG